MTIHLSKVPCKYGAPMGRGWNNLSGKVRLEKVRLNSGGYDSGGAYWGHGEQLWVAQDVEGNQTFLRAANRAEAKKQLPDCTFYR